MSKYEIVELDSGEYAVRKKQNWVFRLLGFKSYYSFNLKTPYSYINEFNKTASLNKANRLIDELEESDYNNRKCKVVRVLND